jgi:Na+/melibiose symporter-like transporter
MAGLIDSVASSVTGRIQRLARARAVTIGLYALAAILVHVAIIVALVTAVVPLANWLGPLGAALIVMATAILIAVVLILIAGAQDRAAREREKAEAAQQRQALNIFMTVLPALKSRDTLLLGAGVALLLWLAGKPGPDDDKT